MKGNFSKNYKKRQKGRKEAGENRATKPDDVRCGIRLFQGILVKDVTTKGFFANEKIL